MLTATGGFLGGVGWLQDANNIQHASEKLKVKREKCRTLIIFSF
jgi:hypothetical protein